MIDFTDPYKFDTSVKCVSLLPTVLRLQEKNKKLEKQLKEANSVIRKELRRQSPKGGVLISDMYDYMKKWGVKR